MATTTVTMSEGQWEEICAEAEAVWQEGEWTRTCASESLQLEVQQVWERLQPVPLPHQLTLRRGAQKFVVVALATEPAVSTPPVVLKRGNGLRRNNRPRRIRNL